MLPAEEAAKVLEVLREDAERCFGDYAWLLNEDADGNPIDPNRSGIARELARMNLTLNTYTQCVLEDRPAQPDALRPAARRPACPVRDPGLCRGDQRRDAPLGAR